MALPKYGVVEYSKYGNPTCHICGKSFHGLMCHVRQAHGMTAIEYKKEFGLDLYTGILSEASREIRRNRVYAHPEIIEGLIKNGEKTRFKEGSSGRTIDKVSPQTMARLIEIGNNTLNLKYGRKKNG